MTPQARITLLRNGPHEVAYCVEGLGEGRHWMGCLTNTAQAAFDYCEGNNLNPVEVCILPRENTP